MNLGAQPIERCLYSHDYLLCQISPPEPAVQRRTDIHGKKTRKTDSAYMTQAYSSKRKKSFKEKVNPYWHVLQPMNRECLETLNHLRTCKVSIKTTLAIVLPDYQTPEKIPTHRYR